MVGERDREMNKRWDRVEESKEGGREEGGGRELSEGRKEMSAGHQTIDSH